jgi:hypothetical protein
VYCEIDIYVVSDIGVELMDIMRAVITNEITKFEISLRIIANAHSQMDGFSE